MQLDEILGRFTSATDDGGGWLTTCPAHADSKPSLKISITQQGKVLLVCRAGCDTKDVIHKAGLSFSDLEGVDGATTATRLSRNDGEVSTADIARLAAQLDAYADDLFMLDGLAEDASEYARSRFGLSSEDLSRLGLGFADDLAGGPRLVVPFRDPDGVARGYQARALSGNASVRWYGPRNPEGATWSKLAYFPGSMDWSEVVVCEGPGDALTAAALGYTSIGIRGARLSSNKTVVDTVAQWADGRPVVIAGDGDPSGRRFSSQLARSLSDKGVSAHVMAVPDGLDVTKWREQDPSVFESTFTRAVKSAPLITSTDATLQERNTDKYPLTDLGNARFVGDYVASRGSGVLYAKGGGYYLLSDGVWRADDRDNTRTYIHEASDVVHDIAKRLLTEANDSDAARKRAGTWMRWAEHSQSTKGINAAERELRALPGVKTGMEAFDNHPHVLACRNGVVDLRTGELLPHDPKLLLTRRVNLDYDPDAQAPRWARFLVEVFPEYPELVEYMRRLIGYGITGSTEEQCFVVHYGHGGNGKGKFYNALDAVFGEIGVTTPFSTFETRQAGGIPSDIAALNGARLAYASEGKQDKPMDEATLKSLTGGDKVTARFLHRDFFTFRPQFLLMLSTNYKPHLVGQDDGLWRRVKMIPWNRYFAPEDRDYDIDRKLRAEAKGILSWAVRGAVEWYRDGLKDPDVVIEATKGYRDSTDALHGFLPGVYVKDETATTPVKGQDLYRDYDAWAAEQLLSPREKWGRNAFFRRLEERKVTKLLQRNVVKFVGIRKARPSEFDDADTEKPDTSRPITTSTHAAPAAVSRLRDT